MAYQHDPFRNKSGRTEEHSESKPFLVAGLVAAMLMIGLIVYGVSMHRSEWTEVQTAAVPPAKIGTSGASANQGEAK